MSAIALLERLLAEAHRDADHWGGGSSYDEATERASEIAGALAGLHQPTVTDLLDEHDTLLARVAVDLNTRIRAESEATGRGFRSILCVSGDRLAFLVNTASSSHHWRITARVLDGTPTVTITDDWADERRYEGTDLASHLEAAIVDDLLGEPT